ncbi:MAG: Gfo/Idh/MocA family oxidoreductase [Calditrichaceae bacterium]
MLNVAVVGVGYWGPNMIRNFHAHPQTNVKLCCDLKEERLNFIKGSFPSVEITTNYNDILKDKMIDLVVVCTPVFTHYELAISALKAGKHVLIEKPMTSTSSQGEEILELAEKKDLKVFVDHTFLFTGAVKKMKEIIDKGEVGDLYYFDSVRVNLGLFQHDVNVIWDLAPHDISIMQFVLNQKPEYVMATGSDHFNNGLEDVAYLTVYYPNKLIAHIHANWLSPVKIRQTLLAGSKKMVVWDDTEPSEKVRIYDKGVEVIQTADQVYNMLIQYRTGDMYCPKIESIEALKEEVGHIVECIDNGKSSIISGESGLMVTKILEASDHSIKNRGKEIRI